MTNALLWIGVAILLYLSIHMSIFINYLGAR